MASTAVHFPVDKDQNQLPYWPDNDELVIAGDNFFDQFVTFDAGDATALGGDVLEDPPSPSILLESLQNEVANSSTNPLDLPLNGSHIETSATTTNQPVPGTLRTPSADQILSDSALFASLAGEPVLNNGSISDSELLHLEGISLQSSPPRGNVTAHSSPTLATSAPLSPQKHGRLTESIYAAIRRSTHRSKPAKQEHYQPVDMTDLDALLSDPRSGLDYFDVNFDDLTDPLVAIKKELIDRDDLPLSPPSTGRIPGEQASPTGFVTGHLEDPFCDEMLGAPAVVHPAKCQGINTPMNTPAVSSDAFFHDQGPPAARNNLNSFRQPRKAYRSASSAEWPIEGLLTDAKYTEDPSMWSPVAPSGAYVTGSRSNIASPNWWETPEIPHAEQVRHHHTTNGNGVHDNIAHNISVYNQQAELPYECNADLLSGLMIHMPQPRTPQASVLRSNLNEHQLATSTPTSRYHHIQGTPTLSRAQTHHFPPQHSSHKGHGHMERRPRPRAPSSGARHHGSQTSPRKLHHSMSLGYLREESHSPSPMNGRHGHHHLGSHHGGGSHHHGSSHQERRQQRTSSLTVRKQRSFSRRGGEPRTPGTSASVSFATTPGGGGGGGGGPSLDFVNFTPDDKNVLMTGVAPSGSSKTKLRREKEQLEKAARLGEAALKAVGGDVDPSILKELMRDFSLPDA